MATGGALSQAYGWRATFVLLTIMLAPVLLLAVVFIPETHHFYALRRVEKQNKLKRQAESGEIRTSTVKVRTSFDVGKCYMCVADVYYWTFVDCWYGFHANSVSYS